MFNSGWSAKAVDTFLKWRYPDKKHPHLSSLERWRLHNISAAVVPHSLLKTKLKGIDYKVDQLNHLSRLIYLLQERVYSAIEVESSLTQGIPVASTDRAVETYLEALRDWRSVAEDMGLVPRRALAPISIESGPITMMGLLAMVTEFKSIEQARVIDGQLTSETTD